MPDFYEFYSTCTGDKSLRKKWAREVKERAKAATALRASLPSVWSSSLPRELRDGPFREKLERVLDRLATRTLRPKDGIDLRTRFGTI